MIWKFLNRFAEKEIEKIGYSKTDYSITDISTNNTYLHMKFTKNVNRIANDTVSIFVRAGHLCISKNRIVYSNAERRRIKFKSDISLNSNETVWFGIILKYIDSIH